MLHDVFSVVVRLDPLPLVARIPVVLPPGLTPEQQAARQSRELAVTRWLADRDFPVVAPSGLVPAEPVRQHGFPMTFWELAEVTDDHSPYSGVEIDHSATLHAELAEYPAPLPFLAPFNQAIPLLLNALVPGGPLTADDVERAHREFEALRPVLSGREVFAERFPGVGVQPIQGDAPSHNVIRTVDGIRFSDFEDITLGPVEWDLAGLGPEAVAEYDVAARERDLRPTDPVVQQVMDAARSIQMVACVSLIPQLPLLADGLTPMIEAWRKSEPITRILH